LDEIEYAPLSSELQKGKTTVAQSTKRENEIINFLRKRDYKLIRELGQGACGKTVLLYDDQIEEHFVCKKYAPFSEDYRQELFSNFVREIKLLHAIHHENIVRVFNYYLYPDNFTGYILMEFINGIEIDKYISRFPEQTNEIFLQVISGFNYLEKRGILHRDIRTGNLMVHENGTVKIIDLGFGKQIRNSKDFDKSISLNWWCEPPNEFNDSLYDFRTEVYFVGKLFEGIIQEHEISHFKYLNTLGRMCHQNPISRIQKFSDVDKEIKSDQFFEIDFSEEELEIYRRFSKSLSDQITQLEPSTQYVDDIGRITLQLNDVYRSFMLEQWVPDAAVVLNCFIAGTYHYMDDGLPVVNVKDFLRLLKITTDEKRRIILSNLHTRFDALPRCFEGDENNNFSYDDIPF
jgi:eukaryotic-like serine/threonine-protein kinase